MCKTPSGKSLNAASRTACANKESRLQARGQDPSRTGGHGREGLKAYEGGGGVEGRVRGVAGIEGRGGRGWDGGARQGEVPKGLGREGHAS